MRRGQDADDFLRCLPDAIARAAERGQPVVFTCDAEPPEHVRRLMATLGVPVKVSSISTEGARSMGNFIPLEAPAANGDRGPDWIDYRASVARAARRLDAGDEVAKCAGCRTELDVDQVVHSPRCTTPDAVADERGPDRETADPVAEMLRLLQASALELSELGATDPAIATHFANVCAHALHLRNEEASG